MKINSSGRQLLSRIRACTICAEKMPHDPRPVLSWHPEGKILLIGQAPGTKVHESGVAWQDPSGNLLRTWLGVDDEQFYDPRLIALVPLGFCYPGKGKSGDLPPRPECAPQWHDALRQRMEKVELTLLVGRHAQDYYLGQNGYRTLTENVRNFVEFTPDYFPLPHPSPRNRPWLAANPWFETKVLPKLRRRIRRVLKS
jgi:uracil-DNA glycosylase